jgi:hypothetical protein
MNRYFIFFHLISLFTKKVFKTLVLDFFIITVIEMFLGHFIINNVRKNEKLVELDLYQSKLQSDLIVQKNRTLTKSNKWI